MKQLLEDLERLFIARIFPFILAHLAGGTPLAFLRNLRGNQLNDDVHRLNAQVAEVACQMRADTVAVLHASADSLVERESTVGVKRIAEDDLFRSGVDAELAILGTDFLQLLQIVAAIDT